MPQSFPELSSRLRALTTRRSGLAVGLWGEPGIGKTHLAESLLRETPCQSVKSHATTPLRGWLEALPSPAQLPAWVERTLELVWKGQEVPAGSLVSALSAYLAALAPFVLYLEDLHEVGGERRTLVEVLGQAISRTRGLGLLVSSRTPPPETLEAVKLERLTAVQAHELLQVQVGAGIPVQATDWIYGRAAGNPLFSVEYFRFLARQGALWNDGQHWHWRLPGADMPQKLPTTVEALIELMVRGALREDSLREVLTSKALLGVGLERDVWAGVAQVTPAQLDMACLELMRRGLLSGDEFIHPLYREVLLRHLPPAHLQEHARRALQVMAGDPAAVSELVEQASLERLEALKWLLHAAHTAEKLGNQVQAARLNARASALAGGQQAAQLALAAAQELREIDVAEAIRLAQQAAQDSITSEEALWLQAELLATQCKVSEAEALLEQLPEEVRQRPDWSSRLLNLRGNGQDHAGVLALLEDAHVRQNLSPGAARRAAWALAQSGQTAQAEALLAEVEARFPDSPAVCLQLRKAASLVAYARADFARMETLEAEVLTLARQEGNLRLVDAALFNRALALEYLERYQERMACLNLADPTAYVIAETAYAGTLAEFGQYEKAETLLLDAATVFQHTDVNVYTVDCECALAHLYWSWRLAHGAVLAQKHAGHAVELARAQHNPRTLVQALGTAVEVECWAGQPERAMLLAQEALALTEQIQMPLSRLEARLACGRALAASGRNAEALEALQDSQGQAQSMKASSTAHQIGLEIAALQHDAGAAAIHRAWFASHGLQNSVNIADRSFPPAASPALPGSLALRLDVLGQMHLTRAGQATPIRGQKRKHLLALLLEARLAGRDGCSAPHLCEALSPDTNETDALNTLKANVFKIREALGSELIRTTSNGYALGATTSDAELFLRGGDTSLWRGLYLEGVLLETGDTVRETLAQTLLQRAGALLSHQPAEALRLGRLLLQMDALNLPVLLLNCQALHHLGQITALKKLYAQARADFAEVGETLPSDWHELNSEMK